jgi:hypothetical protein
MKLLAEIKPQEIKNLAKLFPEIKEHYGSICSFKGNALVLSSTEQR